MDDRVGSAKIGGAAMVRSGPIMTVLGAAALSHGINDLLQSLIPAIYPLLKQEFALSFGQIGLITLAFQLTASLLQPFVGLYTDQRPQPYSLPIGMAVTLSGCCCSPWRRASAHPAGGGAGRRRLVDLPSRGVARRPHGLRRPHGFAQSLFQVGGNAGSALGPLLAAFIVRAARPGQHRLVLARGAARHRRARPRRRAGTARTASRAGKRKAAPRSGRRRLPRRKVDRRVADAGCCWSSRSTSTWPASPATTPST